MSKRWKEVGITEIDFQPVFTNTNTVDVWKQWAKENRLVKVKTDSTLAENDGLTPVELCTANTDVPIGVLRAFEGSPNDLPGRAVVRVAVRGYAVTIMGSGTGALADADFGKKFKPDSEGRATLVSTGGYGRTIGGDLSKIKAAIDFIDNYR